MRLKKIAVIFTFVFISILSTGSFFVFSGFISQYQTDYQAYIQKEKSKINTSEILINPSQLYINSAKVSWEDDNKELVVDGVLYDVVSITVNRKGKLVFARRTSFHFMKSNGVDSLSSRRLEFRTDTRLETRRRTLPDAKPRSRTSTILAGCATLVSPIADRCGPDCRTLHR